jgi:hypothetical protein
VSACAAETFAFAATAAMRSALVIALSLLSRNRSSVTIYLSASAQRLQVFGRIVVARLQQVCSVRHAIIVAAQYMSVKGILS